MAAPEQKMRPSPDNAYFISLLGDVIVARSTETVIITGPDIDEKMGPTIQFANDAVERTSGYRPDELIGKRLGMLFSPETMPGVIDVLRTAQESRESIIVDQEARHRTGSIQWLELSTSPVFDKAGKLIHFARIGRDITARKIAERSRETTQRLLASVFGVINEPLVVADNAGKLLMANTAVTRRLGWSIFDLMGRPVTQLLAEADRPQLVDMMTSGTALDQTRQLKCFLLCKGKQPQVTGEIELTSLRQPDDQTYHVLTLRIKTEKDAADKEWSFELAVRDALKGDKGAPSLVAGKLQLVGLEDVRKSLGDKWPAIAERAFAIAEKTIQRHLRPGDIFRKSTEDGFLVLFSQLSETEAQFKARAIADEIRERLTGEVPDLADARIASFASTVDVEEEEAGSEEEIIASIERRLKEQRERVEAESKETMRTGLRTLKILTASATAESGKIAPITFVRLPQKLKTASDALLALGLGAYELETETFLLAGAGERVLGGLTQSVGELIVTPVRLGTLSQPRQSEAWLGVARALGDAAKRQIVVEIRDITRDVAQSRLTDLVMRMSTLFKSIAFELPTVDPAFISVLPPSTRILTVQFGLIPWTPDGQPSANFCRLVKALDARQRRLIVRNPTTPTKIAKLAKIGISLFVNELN